MPSTDHTTVSGHVVHETLAHSYLAYLAAIIFGFILDAFIPFRFQNASFIPVGGVLIVLGSLIVFWSQYSTRQREHGLKKAPHQVTKADFLTGPYRFSRIPTQYGLFLMTLGLSLAYLSASMIVATIVAFIVVVTVFIPKEEKHLKQKYGAPFAEYKKSVRI